MNTQEKKEALVQAVEEIAGKEAAYWEGNPKMQETFQNCYAVSYTHLTLPTN